MMRFYLALPFAYLVLGLIWIVDWIAGGDKFGIDEDGLNP